MRAFEVGAHLTRELEHAPGIAAVVGQALEMLFELRCCLHRGPLLRNHCRRATAHAIPRSLPHKKLEEETAQAARGGDVLGSSRYTRAVAVARGVTIMRAATIS